MLIYARAVYKAAAPEINSLDALIAEDKKNFVENSPPASISEVEPLATGDGQKLRSFTFFPQPVGKWELVSYGDEGEYYLIFTVSSRTKSGYDKALPVYKAMLRAYKETP
jgi:hypothetical protein